MCIRDRYYFEGMNDTEIAELFNTSRSTIQYRRTSSFELLRKYPVSYTHLDVYKRQA